ncbi:hypothetical protein [Reyranella sp.]|uniref:hypothetical protein n=1 Tax=Reyranella sp. TaxID=1929291 RepID=UPI003D11BA4C
MRPPCAAIRRWATSRRRIFSAANVPLSSRHLVEELAGVLWRKRRLRLAEAAAHRRGLDGTLVPYQETVKVALVHLEDADQPERMADAIRATAEQMQEEMRELQEDEAMTRRAVDLLGSRCNDRYEAALARGAAQNLRSGRRDGRCGRTKGYTRCRHDPNLTHTTRHLDLGSIAMRQRVLWEGTFPAEAIRVLIQIVAP